MQAIRNKTSCITAIIILALTLPGALGAEQAQQILDAAGVKGGLIVHIGCGDGKLTAALCANDNLLVHGLDANAKAVEKAREHIRSLGLYGRISVEHWKGPRLPYADNLVNLVVSENLAGIPKAEVMRVLSPGGAAYLKTGRKWTKTVKPRPDRMDEWTHFRCRADGNMVSKDTLVGPPRYVQWVAGPLWQKHHGAVPSVTTMVSAGGRVFYISEDASMGVVGLDEQWFLTARDAFNGLLLWKRPIADWGSKAWSYWSEGHSARFNHPLHVRKRLVAVGDRLYVTMGFNAPLSVLDAATGKTLMTCDGTQYTDEFVYYDGAIYLSVNDRPQKPWPGQGILPKPTKIEPDSAKRIWALDPATGNVRWKSESLIGKQAKPDRMGSMKHLTLIACEKGVFLVDNRDVVCIDRETGRTRWRTKRLAIPGQEPAKGADDLGKLYHNLNRVDMHNLVYYNGVLLVMHSKGHSGYKWEADSVLQALDPANGREMWQHAASPINYLDVPDVFGARDMVWLPDKDDRTFIALDPATGTKKRTISIEKILNVGHHHRCYPNRATENYLLTGRRGAEFIDLATGEITLHHWARTACRYGHMLANGLVYRLPDHCKCYMALQPRGFYALASEKAVGFRVEQGDNPLEKGPAFGKSAAESSQPRPRKSADWPTYRHDPMRSCSTPSAVPANLAEVWRTDKLGRITPPVIAQGKVFAASVDSHTVFALDEETGRTLWTFTAGGRIDSPPTIHNATAIFGSADGFVYCLRVSDGELAWRFRAAPSVRRITAFGRLESPWPVPGSVLVSDGVVFFTAGRSSVLDGGMYAFALDAASGRLLERQQIHEIQTETKTTGQLPAGALSDILLTDGESVYLRKRKLDFSVPVRLGPADAPAKSSSRLAIDGGFLDSQWFHRAFWSFGKSRGNLIVFDERAAYTAAATRPGPNNQSFYIPAGGNRDRIIGGKHVKGPSWLTNVNLQYGGYILFANGRQQTRKQTKTGPKPKWTLDRLDLCPWAMVAAGKTLFVAGFADEIDPKDPWASIEGRRGGLLSALSAADGKELSKYELDAPPVWNGMAAANGRLYISTRDGRLLCMGKKN